MLSYTVLRFADDRQSPRSSSTRSAFGTGKHSPRKMVALVKLYKRLLNAFFPVVVFNLKVEAERVMPSEVKVKEL